MPAPESETLLRRHEAVRRALRPLGLEALVVTAPVNIRYLTNHVGTAGTLVVTPDALHLLIDGRYGEAVRLRQASASACPGLVTRLVTASYDETLVECLRELGIARAGFEAGHVTVSRYEWLEQAIRARAPLSLESTNALVEGARVVKDAVEIATLRDAAARLTAVVDAVWPQVRVGVSERAVAGVVEAVLRDQGYERPAFDTIVASGPNSAFPHHRSGARLLASGDLLLLDFGGVLDGYCSDLSRTVCVGAPSAEGRKLHAAVLEAHDAAVALVHPGVLASDIDAAARTVLDRRGYGDTFVHGTGHGLGLEIHEAPRVGRPRPDAQALRLEAGMVLTIEPGAYVPGLGGVRIEDDVLVTEEGCDVLTSVPRDLVTLGGSWT